MGTLREMSARPDICWNVADLEDLGEAATELDKLESSTFEIQGIALKFRMIGLQVSKLAAADNGDAQDGEVSSTPSDSATPQHSPSASVLSTANDPPVRPFLLFFLCRYLTLVIVRSLHRSKRTVLATSREAESQSVYSVQPYEERLYS